MYYSFKTPQQKVLYTSEIIDGGSDVGSLASPHD